MYCIYNGTKNQHEKGRENCCKFGEKRKIQFNVYTIPSHTIPSPLRIQRESMCHSIEHHKKRTQDMRCEHSEN